MTFSVFPTGLRGGLSRGLLFVGAMLCAGAAMASTTINHQFTAATINPGDVSHYKITIANSSTVPLTSAAVTVILPPQITIVNPPNILNTTCGTPAGTGFTVDPSTAPGSSSVILTNGTIPAGTGVVDGQCSFQIDVTSIVPGNWTAIIPANTTPDSTHSGYMALENGTPVFNTTPASATLAVNTLLNPTGSKTFAPATEILGDPTTLTIKLTNPNAGANMPLTTFVDNLPAGMVVASPAGASTTCAGGTVTAVSGSGSITLNGGTINASSNCNVIAKVIVTSLTNGTGSQVFSNSVPLGAIGNTRGLVSSPAFSQNITVNTPINVTKTFGTLNIPAGQASLATIKITNASIVTALSITSFIDDLTGTTLKILNTASSPVAAPANPAVVCSGTGFANGTLTAPPDLLNQQITLTGAKAGTSGNCTITAYMTSTVDGPHTNSIPQNAVSNPNGYFSPAASAILTANAQLTVAKTVSLNSVAPGQWTEFTVQISNFSGGPVTAVNFKDVLPKNVTQMTLFNAGSGLFNTDAGCTGGTFNGTDGLGNPTGAAPVAGDAGLVWTGGTIVGGVGASPGVCTINIWAQVAPTAATGVVFTNTIAMGTITGTGGAGGVTNINTSSVNVTTVSAGAVTKSFNPTSIPQGGISTLTISIFNRTVTPLTGVNLTDNLPAGVTLAANPAATSTCGGSLQAFPSDTKIILTGGGVAARPPASQDSSCVITANVTSSTLGAKTNNILTSNFSNDQGVALPATATATLTVNTGLSAVKTFTPTSVTSGGISRVKITISNTSSGNLTNVSVDDNTFAGGLTVANPANAATSCAGSPTMVVNPGTGRAQLLGATLAAGGACDFSFEAQTAGAGPWSNTIPVGKITSAEGPSNTAAITATLTAAASQININKSFNPVVVTGGVPSILQIDIINPMAIVVTGVGVTDTYPPGIINYSVPNASTTCAGGTVTAIPGDGKVILTGATLAASQTCHVTVTTTSLKFLNLTNTIPANSIVSDQGYTNPTATSATLSTLQGLGVLKAFSPAYVVPNQVSTLKMQLVSSFDPNAPAPITLTGVSYTDNLPTNVFIAATPNATTTCAGTGPGGLAVVTTSNGGLNGLVTVSQGTIQPGTNCTISVDVVSGILGAYNNTIPANAVTTDQGIPNANAANATLFVVNKPTVSKTFNPTTTNPGQSSVMTVTITNGASVPITGVSLTDTLPAGLAIASTPTTGGTCTAAGGIVTANPGGSTLAVSGATVAANNGTCTFFANVVGNTPGTYINNINPGAIASNEGLTNTGSAQATLTINGPPTLSKTFNPVSILAGATSTLTISFANPDASAVTLTSAFTDALPGNVFVAATPNVGGSCTGTITAVAGSASITWASGSSIPAGGCTISVDVTSSTPGTYTNLIAAGQLVTSAGPNPQPASASLGVGPGALVPPTMAKAFSPSTILVNGTSTLTITLGNPNASALTLSSLFTDTLPANVVVATPANIAGTCTLASVTATSGSGTITYASGAQIPSGGCTIQADVTSAVAGSYTNTLLTTSLVTDGGSPTSPATAGLVVDTLTPPTVVKFFNPSTINPGTTSTLTISLGNSNAATAALISPFTFTDTLPTNVLVAAVPNASTNCAGSTVSTGASSVTITNGGIQSGGCTINVDVTSNVPGGPYVNTINAGDLKTTAGNNTAKETANLFVNPFQPPSVVKSFTPAIIGSGATSKLSISMANPNATDTTIITADMVDTLPAGLTIGTPSNLALGAGCTAAKVVANAGGTTITYQIGGDLPPNGGCSIQVDVTGTLAATYTNSIAVGSLKTSIGNNAVAASANLQILALPTVAKTFTPASIALGGSSSLKLTLGNSNASTALTLASAFVDTLPANLVLGTPATNTGTCPNASIIAIAGGTSITFKSGATLPAAGGCTIIVPVTSATAGIYTNNIPAGALVTTIGSNPSPASATLSILQADLSITKTDGVGSVVPGTSTTYTIVASNAGPSDVANATVTDNLPAAITSATWTCTASVGSSCVASGVGNLAATPVSLLAGGSATYVVVANVSPSTLANVVNTATITAPAGVAEINPGNNTATDTDTVTPQADMQVVKNGPATIVPGQNITYTITATNAGPSTAVSVSLTDPLPGVTTFVSLASPGGWSCLTPAVGAGGTISCTLASFAPSVPAVFTLVVKLPASVPMGTVEMNTATVASTTTDPNPANNTSSTSGTASASADLSIVKTGPASAVPGGPNVVFTTIVTNNGPSDAQGVSVADPTPASLIFVSNSGACTTAFPCALGSMAAGTSQTITSTYQIPSSYPAPTSIVNITIVSSTTNDPTPGNNTSTATVLVPAGVADVAVTKTVSNPTPAVGTNITYTITASDLGPSDATGVEITDVLPSGLTFVSATPSQGSYSSATGVWTLGGLPVGTSQTLAIVATVTQAGAISNTATKTKGNQTDPNSSNNSGTAIINGPPAVADIQVQKTVDNPTPTVGSTVTFTITVVNAGPSAATNVAITDLLPAGLTFVSATPATGSYASGTGIWTIGAMANGASTTLTLSAMVTASGTIVNVAHKTAETEFDPNTGNDTASAVVGGGGPTLADLSIQKTDSPDPVFAGQPLTYTLLVTNHGPAGATNVTVTDPLPPTVAFVSALPSQGSCSGTTTVTCALGSLAAGNSATVNIVVTPSAASAPSITNTASVTATETDPNPANNSSTAPTTVTPQADVAIGKTVSNPAPLVSQTFTFTVTATNNGPSTANGVVVTDVLPGNLAFVSAAPSQGLYNAGSGLWTIGSLANGQLETLVLTVVAAVPGPFTNTATKTSQIETDPVSANDTASASGSVLVVADLAILKTHSPATFFRGSTGTFTLHVSNGGTGPTAGLVTVSDTLPAGLTPTAASGTAWGCGVAAQTVTCTRSDSLAVASAWPDITVTVSVLLSAAPSVSNTATVAGGGDITPVNDSSTDVVPVITQADLGIVKTDGVTTLTPGTTTTYTIVVSNSGPSPVTNAVVMDNPPPAITSASWTCSATVGSSCGALSGSGPIASTVSLLAGGAATYSLVATVSPAATGSLANTASVSVPPGTTDPNPSNDSSTDIDTLTPQADMQVVKTGPATLVPGQVAIYTITVTNAGPSTAIAATLTDALPVGTTFVSLTSPGSWSCTTPAVGAGGTISCSNPAFTPAAPDVFTLVVNVTPSVLTGTTVSNTAIVGSTTADPTPGNNSSTTSGTATASADLSIVKTGPATAVPGGPNIVFTLVVTNNGPSDAQTVTVTDPTPANLVFVPNGGLCGTGFPCALGLMAAGASQTITVTYQIPSGYPKPAPVDNFATVSSPTNDPTPGNNTSTATVLVPTGLADVGVAKTVDNPAPAVGTNVTYTVLVADYGPSDATGVEVTDILPTGLTLISATPSQGSYIPGTGVWTVGSVPIGTFQTLSIVATVTQAGTIVNTATKTAGNETDPNSSNNSGSAVINGPPAVADIQVQKTVDVPAPTAGSNVTFTITVVNAGPSAATNVVVTDLLPPGLTFVSASPSTGAYVSGTGIWTIGSMANGATATLSVTATVTANGTYVNLAQKTGETEFDPNTGDDQASAVVVAGGGGPVLADLSVQKTDSPDPVFAGQPLTYTLLVTNHGPADATAVTVTDPLPATVTLVSATPSQGLCSGTTTVTCSLGGLAAGNSATISLVVSVSAAAVPAITNTATVAATETDPNPTDNSSTAPTTVIPVADVAVAKTVSNPSPLVSQTFTFTVTATNNGPSTANGVIITDVLPANLTFLSATATQGSYNVGTGLWTVGSLTNGQIETLTLTVLAAAPGAFTNTATKTSETELDPVAPNNTASAGGGVGIVADLTIVKTHAPATFLLGGSGTFTLTVSNVGSGVTAGLVTVSDTLPAGLTPTAASGTGWGCTVAAPTVTCTRSDALGAGASWPSIGVTASVAQSASPSLSNTAIVSGGGDITPANDSSTDVVPTAAQADLMITKTGPPNAIPGTNIVYTLVVTNNGPSDAQGVVVSDPTPPNLTFVSNSGACATAFPCNIATLPAGGSATITATFGIPDGYTAPTPIVNAASVTATTTDPTPSNNSSSASTAVAADLEVVKTATTSVNFIGAPFTYQIVVTNHGPSPATGVTMTDALPAQLTFQSATTTQGNCSGSSTVTCDLGTLANGASATVLITVLPLPTTPTSISNTATVTENEFDPNTANNSSTASATIGNPQIPTLSEWGLMMLALALALAGALALKRPQA